MARPVDANELKEIIVDGLDAVKESMGEHSKMIVDAAIFAVCNSIDRAETVKQDWISVKDRLPRRRREYLCLCQFGDDPTWRFHNVLMFHPEKDSDNGYVKGPHFSNEGMDGMKVTHWMPLPEPPKDGE